MINGLGLFASLAAPETAQPQPATGDDPALFAAALVAALGLQQPVQVTVTPVPPVVDGETVPDEGEETAPEQELEIAAALQPDTESPAEVGRVAPIVARITPDPEVEEEAEAFDRVHGAAPAKPVKAAPVMIDVVIDEPATPGPVRAPEVTKVAATNEVAAKTEVVAPPAAPGPFTIPLPPPTVVPAKGAVAVSAEVPTEAPRAERKAAKVKVDAPAVPAADPPVAAAPVVAVAPPSTVVPPIPVVPPVQAPAASAPEPDTEPRNSVDAPAPKVVPVSSPATVPPQSVQERTARAMAENVRLGRQLAELLGEENVTEFKIELSQRKAPEAKAMPRPMQQQVVQEEAAPVTPWTEQLAPTLEPQPKPVHRPVQGTFAQEAIEPILSRPFTREPSLVTPLTARPEIVRMVANASLATSPDLTQTEGAPAVAKAPAPSVTPSLPDVRQELPAAPERDRPVGQEDSERPRLHESHSSADASASSAASANNSPASRPAAAPGNRGETREARNLPSHESTEQKAAGSADRVTLKVADDEGRQTRIRVSVTGSQIRAVITPPDGMSARQLEQRMDQLHDTLVRQGFTDPKVVIRAAPEIVSDAAALVGASGSQEGRSAAPAGKDQPAGDQRQGRGQREQDRGDGHRHPQGHSRERDPRDRRR